MAFPTITKMALNILLAFYILYYISHIYKVAFSPNDYKITTSTMKNGAALCLSVSSTDKRCNYIKAIMSFPIVC